MALMICILQDLGYLELIEHPLGVRSTGTRQVNDGLTG